MPITNAAALSIGEATACSAKAEELIASRRGILDQIAEAARQAGSRPRVFCLEWLNPIDYSGHSVSEMVCIAGGVDQLGHAGADSVRVAREDVLTRFHRYCAEFLLSR